MNRGRGSAAEARTARPGRLDVADLAWREVADAVWLTAVTGGFRRTDAEPTRPPEGAPAPRVDGAPEAPAHVTRDERAGRHDDSAGADRTEAVYLSPADLGRTGRRPPPALVARSAHIVRALRPLKRKVEDWREDHVVLDEVLTAERAVQDGLWLPMMTRGTVRWLDLTVVVDAGPSMALWTSTVTAFLAQLQQIGAFHTIQLRLLDTRAARPTLHGGTLATPARGPAELVDPSGRRVMLVLTDGVGEAWRRNRVAPMLALWGASMPVAVVHVLPQRLWPHQGLDLHRARLEVTGRLRPNRRWRVELADAWLEPDDGVPPGAVPVPVLELGPRWLGWWARLITEGHGGAADAMVLLAGAASSRAVRETAPVRDESGRQRVHRFVSVASPPAVRLATLLAAVPVNLDVVRLVQDELVPESGPDHLAEVLTSGLLRPSGDGSRTWDTVVFDFGETVRDVLLSGARRSDTANVLRLVTERFGDRNRALRHLRAALADPDATPDPMITPDNAYYVMLERTVMRALSGPYLSRADRLTHLVLDQAADEEAAASTPRTTIGTEISTVSDNMADLSTHADLPGKPAETATPVAPAPRSAPLSETAVGEPGPSPTAPRDTPETFPMLLPPERQGERVPVVWGNVPPRNPNFTGRTELLEALGRRLAAGGTTAILPAALHGMGGIGKTQIAVEYIYRHLEDYEIVWWIQAAQLAQVRAGLTELAQVLRLPGSSESPTAVPAVREALRLGKPYRRWLLVFDAAESPDTVRQFFPAGGTGNILITSRNPDWASVARPLEVAVFHRDESVELLRRRGPELEDDDADQLADKLGDLPLAIEQAAAWRAETGMPVSEYLRLFDEKVAEILDTSAPAGYEVSVAAAWNVSFDELRTRSPAAHQLLQVCAFFAPEPISRSLFTGVRGVSISEDLDVALRDPMQLSRAIRDINRYGLAKIDHRKATLQLHRLVQIVLRNRMTDQRREEMRHGAHILLANYDPNDPQSSKLWPRYADILPHVQAAELTESDDPWVCKLVINLMRYLYFWGDLDEASALARRALDRWTVRLAETNPHAMDAASFLGMYLWALGRYTEAAQLNRRTLELRRQVSGENSEEAIIAQLRVAVDMRSAGDFRGARELNEQIFDNARRLYGEDDPITLQTAHDLAVSVRLCGDYQRAFELDKVTSERRAEVLGYDNVDTLNTMSGMYMDRRELGDYAKARKEHERIAQRVQELLGEDKVDTLRRFAYLAVTRRKDGDHAGAFELSTKALELYRHRYGEDHPMAMACAIDHSNDLRHADDLPAARALGNQTLERYRAKLGDSHPHTLSAAVDLAVTLRLCGEIAAARQLDETSLERIRAVLGPEHPYAVVCAANLASDLAALGEAETALALGTEAVGRAGHVLGARHPTTLAARLNIAFDLRALGRSQEAETQYAEVLALFREVLGPTHPTTLAAVRNDRANCDIDPLPL
jgi:tetratricopeptide (TPR) repeat protein